MILSPVPEAIANLLERTGGRCAPVAVKLCASVSRSRTSLLSAAVRVRVSRLEIGHALSRSVMWSWRPQEYA